MRFIKILLGFGQWSCLTGFENWTAVLLICYSLFRSHLHNGLLRPISPTHTNTHAACITHTYAHDNTSTHDRNGILPKE